MKEGEVDAGEVRRIAKAVAQRYANRCWWADRDDLQSEATVAILAAVRTWDPQVGVPFDGYAARAAALRVKDYLWRESSPVSGGLHDPRKHIAGVHGAQLKDDVEYARPLSEDPATTIDEVNWRLRVRRRIRVVANRHRDGNGSIAYEIMVRGAPYEGFVGEVGQKAVYAATELVRRRIRSDARLYAMWRQKVPLRALRTKVDPLVAKVAESIVMRSVAEILEDRRG